MDKAARQIKAGKASEKKPAVLHNRQPHPAAPPRERPVVLCLSSLRAPTVTSPQPSLSLGFFPSGNPCVFIWKRQMFFPYSLLQQVKE